MLANHFIWTYGAHIYTIYCWTSKRDRRSKYYIQTSNIYAKLVSLCVYLLFQHLPYVHHKSSGLFGKSPQCRGPTAFGRALSKHLLGLDACFESNLTLPPWHSSSSAYAQSPSPIIIMVHIFHGQDACYSSPFPLDQRIILTEVVLQALSLSAYTFVSTQSCSFADWLSSFTSPLRAGEVLNYATSTETRAEIDASASGEAADRFATFIVKMTEPVEQGYWKSGMTRLSVLSPDFASPETPASPSDDYLGSNEDLLEIDESFLRNAITSPALHSSLRSEGQQRRGR